MFRRRTFDEIREENRRRQLQQNFPSVGRGERAWPEGDNSERKPQERSQRSGRGQGRQCPIINLVVIASSAVSCYL